MEIIQQPTCFMGVALLHKCNFNCEHCGYIYVGDSEDHIVRPGYRLTWEQLKTVIADCKGIKDSTWSMLFTGGEPTLWEEGDLKFIDLLLEVAGAGISPGFNTNGSYFDDYDQCHDFFNRYTNNANVQLQTFISMDKFHNNYDQEKGRAKSLDNVVKVLDETPEDKKALHKIHVVIIVTNDPNSSLPEEMKRHYGAKGITFGDFPMMPIGKAKNLKSQLPDPSKIKLPPPPKGKRLPGALVMGDYYYQENKKVAKLGHLIGLFPDEAANE
jgi:MoaA/NifB/PqqE/SkfB family radical SAM enzyme